MYFRKGSVNDRKKIKFVLISSIWINVDIWNNLLLFTDAYAKQSTAHKWYVHVCITSIYHHITIFQTFLFFKHSFGIHFYVMPLIVACLSSDLYIIEVYAHQINNILVNSTVAG